MKCKACDAELEEGQTLCPACGVDNAQEEVLQPAEEMLAEEMVEETTEEATEEATEEVTEEVTEEAAEEATEEVTEEATEEAAEEEPAPVKKSKIKLWQVILGVAASLIVLAALAIVLLYAFGVDLRPRPNNVAKKDSYVVSAEQALKQGDKVIATVNGKELTNGALHIYYRMQVVDFLNTNMSYLSYMGLDYTQPLSAQTCYYDENLNWEQYFIDVAIETWRNYQTVYMLSVEEGFVPSEDLRVSLEELPASMEEMAIEEGYESADALMQDRFGAPCSIKDYLDYCRVMYVSSEYINVTPDMDTLEAFYTENESFLVENGVGKESGPMVNVRHILLTPHEHEEEVAEETEATETAEETVAAEETDTTASTEETETTEEGYSADAWAECLQNAEDLLAQWKAGDATEESFAELANTYSVDGGSNTTGGLYTGITSDASYVENFLNWCMDESRQVGDTGIVQTEYGYHIMYFAYTQPKWLYYTQQYYLSDRTDKLLTAAKEKWPIEVTYKSIAMENLDLT